MNNKTYLTKLVSLEAKKIKQNLYISKLIKEEYEKLYEKDASSIRNTLKSLNYTEKKDGGPQLDVGGPMAKSASILFIKFFKYLKKELPNIRIEVTGGNDNFHKKYLSRHLYGEAIDFVITAGDHRDVWDVCKKFRSKHSDFKCLDEYTNRTEHATGDHFHIAYIGSDSIYEKKKRDGALPEVQAGTNRLVYPVDAEGNTINNTGPFLGKRLKVTDYNSINKWEGNQNGIDLAAMDAHLNDMAVQSKGGAGGSSIMLYDMKAQHGDNDVDTQDSHKWIISALIKVPPKTGDENDLDPDVLHKVYGNAEPDAEGILPVAPETITFYPTGHAYMYNMGSHSDPALETKKSFINGVTDLLRNVGLTTTLTVAWLGGMKAIKGGKVVVLDSVAGDLLGTLYVDGKNRIILDLTGTPQFSVDAGYEPTGTEKFLNQLQFILDLVGFIPVIGDVVDFINAIIYYLRERYFEAFLSVIAIIPVFGSIIKGSVKGAMKIGQGVTKGAGAAGKKLLNKRGINFISKGMAKKLFKKGPEGEAAAAYFLEELVSLKVITKDDLAKVDISVIKKLITSKSKKTKNVFKKYMKSDTSGPLPSRVFKDTESEGILKSFNNAADNISMALKKYSDDAIKKLKPFGPKAMKGKAVDTNLSSGLLGKAIQKLTGPMRKGNRFRRIRNILGRIPTQRANLIKEWMFKEMSRKLLADPKLLNDFLQSVGSKGLQKARGSNKFITKLKPGQQAELLKKIMKNEKDLIIQRMMADPFLYFGAQLKHGLGGTARDLAGGKVGSLYTLIKSSLGPKSFDVVYNEVKEVLWKEMGIDIGGYGDEQESIVAATLFAIFCDAEEQKSRRERRISAREEISMLAGGLKFLGLTDRMITFDRDQIQNVQWNVFPGDTNDEKMAWVRTQGNPKDIKTIEDNLYKPLKAQEEKEGEDD